MNHIRITVCSIVLLILAGCKSGKELISERPVSQEVRNNFESLMASYPDWNTFSAKGSADLSFGASGSLSASTQLRMVRGEVLQISVRIILGIHGFQLFHFYTSFWTSISVCFNRDKEKTFKFSLRIILSQPNAVVNSFFGLYRFSLRRIV